MRDASCVDIGIRVEAMVWGLLRSYIPLLRVHGEGELLR